MRVIDRAVLAVGRCAPLGALLAGVLAVLWVFSVLIAFGAGETHGAKLAAKACPVAAPADPLRVQEAQAAVQRAEVGGRQHEATRTRIDAQFRALEKEAAHAAPSAVDACVLPADRLQLWSQANAGPGGADPASGQPDDAPAATAPAGLGPDAGLGGQPPGHRPALPPAGQPDVRPADLPAGPHSGV